MKTFNRLGLAIVCAAALSAMFPASSRADTIYTYTGNAFDTILSSPYTISESVSGWIDLSLPLGDSVGPQSIFPVSFSFSDGVQTITNNDYVTPPSFFDEIRTNASGDIVKWQIIVVNGVGGIIATINYNIGEVVDYAGVGGSLEHGFFTDATTCSTCAGTWVVSTTTITGATTPIPAALPLFASGLGAMGLLGWWRKRKNGAPLSA